MFTFLIRGDKLDDIACFICDISGVFLLFKIVLDEQLGVGKEIPAPLDTPVVVDLFKLQIRVIGVPLERAGTAVAPSERQWDGRFNNAIFKVQVEMTRDDMDMLKQGWVVIGEEVILLAK